MTDNPEAVEVTQADIAAWEIYGPAIFHCAMTGPEALARHRIASNPNSEPPSPNPATSEVGNALADRVGTSATPPAKPVVTTPELLEKYPRLKDREDDT